MNLEPEANKLSPSLKNLFSRIFVADHERISIDEILTHPWMTAILPKDSLELNFKKLKEFSNFSKVRDILFKVKNDCSDVHCFSVAIKIDS